MRREVGGGADGAALSTRRGGEPGTRDRARSCPLVRAPDAMRPRRSRCHRRG
ncbi:conserved hypothetical protein [Burkholderia mallei PRL-20]|nr:conserved hypothetical protein [Burkholderia mallei SAVP1]EDP88388.1 conserved hypothetical protein [Burkholderia mallei ATCC 10399]EEP87825.1 conserved hypothetical protein [Burkholderia mallei GB8 horse 4]EES44180.1 conserved hypothetical protein [Burkholderia mallei PRL-20]